MGSPFRNLSDVLFVAVALGLQWRLAGWLLAMPGMRRSHKKQVAIRIGFWTGCGWLVASLAYSIAVMVFEAPTSAWFDWVRGLSLAWGICLGGLFAVGLVVRRLPKFDPGRRKLFTGARAALFAVPVAVTAAGVLIERTDFRVREVNIPIQGLPADLDGLRLVQISDIHLGPFLEEADLRRVVAMANETRADIGLVTGDLITLRPDRLSDCLRVLKDFRAEAGVFGCMGNHEALAHCRRRAQREGARVGIDFLRSQTRPLRFGTATLNLAGVDYQPMGNPYLIGAETLLRENAVNLLLSHNPDVFPVAARQGWDLTLAGHTHGGQVTIEILNQYLNVARYYTPYVYGLYRKGRSSIYVNRGIGTVAVPVRIGAPPEIGLIKLCAT